MNNNKIIDHHVHTNYSPDADSLASMEHYINKAKELKLPGVMFTDHVDLDSPVELFQQQINYKNYKDEIRKIQNKTDMPIQMGVEVGYQPHIHNQLNSFLSQHPFDFVICSMHVCDRLDFYYGDYFTGKNQEQSYQRYFEAVLESVQGYQNYDVYGHLDYIIRYGQFERRQFELKDYQEVIDSILKTIISNGKGIEVNTSGIRYNLNVMHPKFDIIKRYKELGGEIITIGSDSHKVDDLYANVDDALLLLKEAGFQYVTQFNSRKPSFKKIIKG